MYNNLSSTFAALGEPTRFAIVERLLREGEQSAGDLHNIADLSPPAISRHLRILRQAGVVDQRIDAQRRLYSVHPGTLKAISAWTMSYRDFWDGSLDRLAMALDKENSNK
ncbi:metalloregulator ArsR/SmtB family transcription factor [uncultured Sneathiella sp.]|uniref:ArsR/SmtB family transcription factor n=1 Tax=uncultured Sneathiella sp. TaxID=879315 RepID=UPI0030DCFEB3|tara:strand:- start:567 stop:896 length:330 start_codon:yes stop_codon:yes gene_type:complete